MALSILPKHLALRETFNRRLTLAILLITFSQFNFGFDQQGFAATQAMDSFAKQFGEYNPEAKKYFLPPVWLSWFNGINYLGQATGTFSWHASVPASLSSLPPADYLLVTSLIRLEHLEKRRLTFAIAP